MTKSKLKVACGKKAYRRNHLAPYTKATSDFKAKYGSDAPIPRRGTLKHKEWTAMAKRHM